MGAMLANFHMCGIMLLLRTDSNMVVQEGLCLMFSLPGPCALLFLFILLSLEPEL